MSEEHQENPPSSQEGENLPPPPEAAQPEVTPPPAQPGQGPRPQHPALAPEGSGADQRILALEQFIAKWEPRLRAMLGE